MAEQMVWLVWSETGWGDDFRRGGEGGFETKELADAFKAELGRDKKIDVEVQAVQLLTAVPLRGIQYYWADRVTADGRISPDVRWAGDFVSQHMGHARSQILTWQNQIVTEAVMEQNARSKAVTISVKGGSLAWVEAEYARLLKEAWQRLGLPGAEG